MNQLVEIMENEVQESAFDLVRHVVEAHRQGLTNSNYYKQESAFAGRARELIQYKSLNEKDREYVDYFDRNFKK